MGTVQELPTRCPGFDFFFSPCSVAQASTIPEQLARNGGVTFEYHITPDPLRQGITKKDFYSASSGSRTLSPRFGKQYFAARIPAAAGDMLVPAARCSVATVVLAHQGLLKMPRASP